MIVFSKHIDWEENFIKGGYEVGTIKEAVTVTGLFGSDTFSDGVPVMKCWDREEGVAEMEIDVPKGQRVIIETHFIWVQVLNGWLYVDLNDSDIELK